MAINSLTHENMAWMLTNNTYPSSTPHSVTPCHEGLAFILALEGCMLLLLKCCNTHLPLIHFSNSSMAVPLQGWGNPWLCRCSWTTALIILAMSHAGMGYWSHLDWTFNLHRKMSTSNTSPHLKLQFLITGPYPGMPCRSQWRLELVRLHTGHMACSHLHSPLEGLLHCKEKARHERYQHTWIQGSQG